MYGKMAHCRLYENFGVVDFDPTTEYVSPRIHSLGKFALDASDDYFDCLINHDAWVVSSRGRLEALRQANVPDEILNDVEQRAGRVETQVRDELEEWRDPERYRQFFAELRQYSTLTVNSQGGTTSFADSLEYTTQLRRFDRIFNAWEPSAFIDQMLGVEIADQTGQKKYVDAILATDDDGNYRVDTEQFRNFLQWHNYEHMKAERKVNEKLPEYKERFKKMLADGVADGQMPKNAQNNVHRIDGLSAILDDGLESVSDRKSGSFHAGADRVGDSFMVAPDAVDQYHVYAHEFLHDIEGEVSVDDDRGYGRGSVLNIHDNWVYDQVEPTGTIEYEDGYVGATYSQDDMERMDILFNATRILREATGEKLTTRLLGAAESRHYRIYKRFVDDLIAGSDGILTENDFDEAFFENDADKFAAFMDKIQGAYPGVENIFMEIGQIESWKYYSEREKETLRAFAARAGVPRVDTYTPDDPDTRFISCQEYVAYLNSLKFA